MLCKDLKVVSLNIAEDNYQYKALFRLCTDEACMDIDLEMISEDEVLCGIKSTFSVEEPVDVIKEVIMQKVMEASEIESRITEGKDCCEDVRDTKIQRDIDALSTS